MSWTKLFITIFPKIYRCIFLNNKDWIRDTGVIQYATGNG